MIPPGDADLIVAARPALFKVWRIREYMDTRGGWAQVFGESEPVQLIEFVVG
jgi:hypothetical protein